jgi:predicted TIM-barrel fold metal-dependent hydrolase
MWGTDYPPTLNGGTYRQLLDWVRRHCAFLSDEQRAAVVGRTAERFLEAAIA